VTEWSSERMQVGGRSGERGGEEKESRERGTAYLMSFLWIA